MGHRRDQSAAYLRLAREIENQITQGVLHAGDKLPSVRALSRNRAVSISTVLASYFWLENRGFAESRPRSGFYVRLPSSELVPEPQFRHRESTPRTIGSLPTVEELLSAANDLSKFNLGASFPDSQLFPTAKLNKLVRAITRAHPDHSSRYHFPPGAMALREQIAQRSIEFGCNFNPDEIVITNGAIEAIVLGLRAVARPGDVVVVEVPVHFGVLQAIESVGMKVIEVPSHHRHGINPAYLEQSIKKHNVKACVLMPNCQNPLGYVLSEDWKQEVVRLAGKYDVPIIENDVYRDVAFGERRPKPLKAYDTRGLVLLCSSYSKVLGPGFRLGWIHAGRFKDEIERAKFRTSIAAPSLSELTIAEYLKTGNYERHLRRIRSVLPDHLQAFSRAVAKYFPDGTRLTRPAGGYLLWVELPKRVDADKLFRMALQKGIYIMPGSVFSTNRRYKNFVRIGYGVLWSAQADKALFEVGKLAGELAKAC